MRCPECYLENYARAKQCVRCGADLTQAALTETEYHGANQVWNTDIDPDRNRKNSRTALAVLGVVVLLVIALVAVLMLYLPKVISYSMDSFTLPELNISDFVDKVFWEDIEISRTEPVPEPDYPPANRLDGADLDFINALTVYATELAYIGTYEYVSTEAEQEIHQMFLPEFEHLAAQVFDSHDLNEEAKWTAIAVQMLSEPELDRIEQLTAMYELSAVMLRVNEMYDIFGADPEVLAYYDGMMVRTAAMLEVEYDLREQLVGTGTVWSKEHGCEIISYTNNTSYTLDISFFNDFVTDTEHYSSEIGWPMLFPGETAEIPLCDLIEIGDQDHTWYLNWEILQLYVDDIPLEDYYED
ncbi:MAG: zinc finger Ran-binding domain-containing family 2 protein [Oscillospiraceae bacterium]|nr:zinc finger Ran-binding domain-containing family 2 protein [Oscillospiraceae bacterium]